MKDVLKTFWPSLLMFLICSFGAAFIGNLATYPAVDTWYADINRPSWNPPRWIFPPVWTLLYIMIGCSGWSLWISDPENRPTKVLTLFFIHLVLNALWSVVFFGMREFGWAFVEICFLWLSIVLYIVYAWPHSRIASILFWPYAGWVTFAAVLNFRIWQLN